MHKFGGNERKGELGLKPAEQKNRGIKGCKIVQNRGCVNFYTFFYNIYTRVCEKSSNFAA